MYSLVNVTVVARDLTRHRYGAAIARDLLHVLALDQAALESLDALGEPADAPRRRQLLAREQSDGPRAHEALGLAETHHNYNPTTPPPNVESNLERTWAMYKSDGLIRIDFQN